MTAVSTIGRILSVILGVYGIIVVALITSIIVNFYGEMKKTNLEEADPEEAPAPDAVPGSVPDPVPEAGQETKR